MQNVSICDCFFLFISGQDSVWAGKIQGFLNLLLRASVAQQELDIVDQMWVEFRMRSWGFTMFWGGSILRDYIFFILDLDLL